MKFPKIRLTVLSLIFVAFTYGCGDDDDPIRANPNLPNLNVNLTLDLSLPQYNPLNFPGNSLVTGLQGVRGIVIYNIDNNQYTAFEISDPNHTPNDCSAAQVNGLTATCSCGDGNEYSIITGQVTAGEGVYPLLAYRISRSGDQLVITN